jgi:hypothetical protein
LRDHVHDCLCASLCLCGETRDYIGFYYVARATSRLRFVMFLGDFALAASRGRGRPCTQAPHHPCLRWFLEFFTGCAPRLVLYSRNRMWDRTETLSVGSRAPEFLLSAANRDGILSLSGFLSRGALIVEFLRGTW